MLYIFRLFQILLSAIESKSNEKRKNYKYPQIAQSKHPSYSNLKQFAVIKFTARTFHVDHCYEMSKNVCMVLSSQVRKSYQSLIPCCRSQDILSVICGTNVKKQCTFWRFNAIFDCSKLEHHINFYHSKIL